MRRWTWVLWLLIALMPVRGVAQSLMSFAPAVPGEFAAPAAADASPCPMHVAADGAASMPASEDGTSLPSHTCSLCNVCHSAMLPLAFAASTSSTVPDDAPLPALGLGAGRPAPSELFRPPR